MTLDAIRDLLSQKPFKPLRFILDDGERRDVRQRSAVFLTRDTIVIGTLIGGDDVPTDYRICSLKQVSAIESLDA